MNDPDVASAAQPATIAGPRTKTGYLAEGVRGDPGKRLVSLDAFRGATIAAMLLVNNPGSWSHVYAPLRHAEWHGWTPTDLIFPFFLYIMGVAMTYSFAKRRKTGQDDMALLKKIVKRSLVLIALGLVLHGFPRYDIGSMRFPGVLQRIGLAYLVAAPIVAYTGWRVWAAVTAAVLLGYWALLMFVPPPGGAAGVLLPGQDLGAWLDRAVFGTEHLWSQSRTWDPEGLLSTLPAVGTVLTGALTGKWLRSGRGSWKIVTGLAAAGAVALGLGLLWGLAFPINKSLWTSSYVLFTSGFAAVLLALFYFLIDMKGRGLWAKPFVIYGMNAIAAFFLSSLGARLLGMITVTPVQGRGPVALKPYLYDHVFEPLLAPKNASLAFALSYVLFWLVIMTVLYQRDVFIKV